MFLINKNPNNYEDLLAMTGKSGNRPSKKMAVTKICLQLSSVTIAPEMDSLILYLSNKLYLTAVGEFL